MKKAEDYLKEYVGRRFPNLPYESEEIDVIHAIQQAQVDAIEETCGVCAENATFIITEDAIIDAGIETDYYSDGVFTTRISSESILNCAEILKKKLE